MAHITLLNIAGVSQEGITFVIRLWCVYTWKFE